MYCVYVVSLHIDSTESMIYGKRSLPHLGYGIHNNLQVAELASLAQLLPPCSPTVRNPAPDSSLKSCFSPIASASAAARRLRPLQLLLAACIRFSCCSRARLRHSLPLLLALPVCLRLASSCCSPIAPASAAARRPIASASTAAPRLGLVSRARRSRRAEGRAARGKGGKERLVTIDRFP